MTSKPWSWRYRRPIVTSLPPDAPFPRAPATGSLEEKLADEAQYGEYEPEEEEHEV